MSEERKVEGPHGAYSQKEFIEQMRIGRTTFFREVSDGKLRTFRVGRRRYVSYAAAADWLQRKEAEGDCIGH